jgi:hypothetical protein
MICTLTSATASNALEFSQHFNGAMRIDGESTWIYAEGTFESGDTEKFEAFLAEQPVIWKNQRVVLNSGGGDVLEGIFLGRIIRSHGFRTAVAGTRKAGDYSEVTPGICASACVLAFAGGTERGASEDSRIGVHQMSSAYNSLSSGNQIDVDELKANMTITQFLLGMTLDHYLTMGIDPSILPLMVTTTSDDIHWLTLEELKATKIAFHPSSYTPWNVEAYKAGIVAYSRSEDEKKQITLFCNSSAQMRFLLTFSDPLYKSYMDDVNAKQFTVAGVTIKTEETRAKLNNGTLTIEGPWEMPNLSNSHLAVFSLWGQTVGAISDLYSQYSFNETKFTQSLSLAQRNCIGG